MQPTAKRARELDPLCTAEMEAFIDTAGKTPARAVAMCSRQGWRVSDEAITEASHQYAACVTTVQAAQSIALAKVTETEGRLGNLHETLLYISDAAKGAGGVLTKQQASELGDVYAKAFARIADVFGCVEPGDEGKEDDDDDEDKDEHDDKKPSAPAPAPAQNVASAKRAVTVEQLQQIVDSMPEWRLQRMKMYACKYYGVWPYNPTPLKAVADFLQVDIIPSREGAEGGEIKEKEKGQGGKEVTQEPSPAPKAASTSSDPDVMDQLSRYALDVHAFARTAAVFYGSEEHEKEKGAPPAAPETGVLKLEHERLLQLHHAIKCTYAERCLEPWCARMKGVWRHVASCKDMFCEVPHCLISRYLLTHYHRCEEEACGVCVPVRLVHKQQGGSREDKKQDAPAAAPVTSDVPSTGILKQRQDRLVRLRHAAKCTEICLQPWCVRMKKLWQHIGECKDNDCKYQQCLSSRYLLTHYHRCKNDACQVCAPVRRMSKHRGDSKGEEKKEESSRAAASNADILKQSQDRFVRLLHSSKCMAAELCAEPWCAQTKQLWQHIAKCEDRVCAVMYCASSRFWVSHFHRCEDAVCDLCAPVRLVQADKGGEKA